MGYNGKYTVKQRELVDRIHEMKRRQENLYKKYQRMEMHINVLKQNLEATNETDFI